MKLSAEQARYVLDALLSRGRVRWVQVPKVLSERVEEIQKLRDRLASLEMLGGRAPRKGRPRPAARRKLSPKTRALRRLQGKYMGSVRSLTAAEKARVKAVREKKGIEAAIRVAASLKSK